MKVRVLPSGARVYVRARSSRDAILARRAETTRLDSPAPDSADRPRYGLAVGRARELRDGGHSLSMVVTKVGNIRRIYTQKKQVLAERKKLRAFLGDQSDTESD